VAGEPEWKFAPFPDTPDSEKQIREILDALRGPTPDPAVRWQNLQRIGPLRTPGALRALKALYAGEKDFLPRFYAVLGAAEVDGKEAALFLLEALLAEKEPFMQKSVRDALRRLRTREAADVLVGALRHGDPVVRAEAATALGGLRWAGAVPPLLQALRDPQPAPRAAAIEALGRLGTAEAVDALLKAASGADADAALAALGALADSPAKDPRIGEAAAALLEKGRTLPLRIQAAKALGARKDAAGLKALVAALDHADWRLRSAAVGALARIRHRDAIEPLIGRIPKEKGRFLWEVGQALYRITGLDYGTDAEIWRDWWGKNKDAFQPPPVLKAEKKPAPELTEASYHGIPVVSRRIVFVLDVSSSMTAKIKTKAVPTGRQGAPKDDTRLSYCKWELVHAIRALPKEARFNVLVFGDTVRAWQKQIVPAVANGKAEAEKFVDGVAVQGGTNLHDGLKAAFEDLEADTFYVLSDGDPTAGPITDKDEILRWVRRMNAARGIAIHTVSAGELASEDFLQKLAEQNGGKSVVMK
jgi:HEAT repeat protein